MRNLWASQSQTAVVAGASKKSAEAMFKRVHSRICLPAAARVPSSEGDHVSLRARLSHGSHDFALPVVPGELASCPSSSPEYQDAIGRGGKEFVKFRRSES